jgi:hypothetical protein
MSAMSEGTRNDVLNPDTHRCAAARRATSMPWAAPIA